MAPRTPRDAIVAHLVSAGALGVRMVADRAPAADIGAVCKLIDSLVGAVGAVEVTVPEVEGGDAQDAPRLVTCETEWESDPDHGLEFGDSKGSRIGFRTR